MFSSRQFRLLVLALAAGAFSCATAGDITAEGNYLRDANGKTMFIAGYYDWASTVDGHFLDSDACYKEMIDLMGKYGGNYIRVSLGINTFSSKTSPSSLDGRWTPIPFKLDSQGRANLDAFDQRYFDHLKEHVQNAAKKGVIVHVAFFDGVDIRGGKQQYRWVGSFWNIDNQTRNFFGDLDKKNNSNADAYGEFYRTTDFRNNTGVGKYQRLLIDKTIATVDGFDNVYYEVGNELFGARKDWYDVVIDYIQTKTKKAVTTSGGQAPSIANNMGLSTHDSNAEKPGSYRKGYPFIFDPDNNSFISMSTTQFRSRAWYSLVSGAAGFGGFTDDFWNGNATSTNPKMLGYLLKLLKDSNIDLAQCTPEHGLISNPGKNGCLARRGKQYLCYVRSDAKVTLNLGAASGTLSGMALSTETGATAKITAQGGARRTISRSSGISGDWAFFLTDGDQTQTIETSHHRNLGN